MTDARDTGVTQTARVATETVRVANDTGIGVRTVWRHGCCVACARTLLKRGRVVCGVVEHGGV